MSASPKPKARRITAIVLAGVIVFALASVPPFRVVAAPVAAPDFVMRSVEGEEIALAKLLQRGPVLIDFWATWCRPCLAAIPELNAVYERVAPLGVQVVGISVDGPRNFAKVRPFVRRLGMRYPVAIDPDGRLQESFGVHGVPSIVVIDRSGRVVASHQGYRPGEIAELEALLRGLSAGAAADSAASAPRDRVGDRR